MKTCQRGASCPTLKGLQFDPQHRAAKQCRDRAGTTPTRALHGIVETDGKTHGRAFEPTLSYKTVWRPTETTQSSAPSPTPEHQRHHGDRRQLLELRPEHCIHPGMERYDTAWIPTETQSGATHPVVERRTKQHQGRRNLLRLTETTHSDASWRPGSRRTRRPSSACGRRCGRNAGRPCGSWYASYRTKPFPSSARHKTTQQIRENAETDRGEDKHPTSQQTSTTDTRTRTQDRREDKQNKTDGRTNQRKKNAEAVSIVCAGAVEETKQVPDFAEVFAVKPLYTTGARP